MLDLGAQPLFPFLGRLCGLDLLGAAELLGPILALLPQFARGFLHFFHKSCPNETMLGLKLLLSDFIVIDQSKPSAPPSTEMCPKSESNNTVFVSLVDSGEFFRKIRLRDIRAARVENVDDELAARQQTVSDELACP